MHLLIGALLVIGAAEALSYLIYRSNRDISQLIKAAVHRDKDIDMGTFTPRYIEHPFLAFAPNPDFRNSFGEKVHNRYGFRNSYDFSDPENSAIIYCAGASWTYCNFIEKNDDTWPAMLENDLKANVNNADIRVVNGACGAWTSYQSLIRFSAWVDVLKPKLVIMCHGKNDFSPFVNAKDSVREIFPDYGNVIYSLRFDQLVKVLNSLSRFSYTIKIFQSHYINTKYSNIVWNIYRSKVSRASEICKKAEAALRRVGSKEVDFIFSRYRSFASLCEDRGIPILFVTEKVMNRTYEPLMRQLNERIKSLECRQRSCFVYDFNSDNSCKSEEFFEYGHFSKKGARIYADHIGDYISRNIPLFKKQEVYDERK